MSLADQETKNISVVFILEAIGMPPEHLVEALEGYAKQMDEEKGVKVISKKIKDPELIKDQKNFYTTFMEIEIEVEEILYLAILMFKYMPAHVEIVSPELIALTNDGWNDIFNELTRRLHGYDEIARVLQNEKVVMQKKIQELTAEKELESSGKKSVVKKTNKKKSTEKKRMLIKKISGKRKKTTRKKSKK